MWRRFEHAEHRCFERQQRLPIGGGAFGEDHQRALLLQMAGELLADLAELDVLSKEELLNRRYQRLMTYGYA